MPSFLRRQESSHYRLLRVSAIKLVGNNYDWIPAYAGMTKKEFNLPRFTSPEVKRIRAGTPLQRCA